MTDAGLVKKNGVKYFHFPKRNISWLLHIFESQLSEFGGALRQYQLVGELLCSHSLSVWQGLWYLMRIKRPITRDQGLNSSVGVLHLWVNLSYRSRNIAAFALGNVCHCLLLVYLIVYNCYFLFLLKSSYFAVSFKCFVHLRFDHLKISSSCDPQACNKCR